MLHCAGHYALAGDAAVWAIAFRVIAGHVIPACVIPAWSSRNAHTRVPEKRLLDVLICKLDVKDTSICTSIECNPNAVPTDRTRTRMIYQRRFRSVRVSAF
jgi:hypothetical protein